MSLDPFEIIIDQLDKNVSSLENQSTLIKPLVSQFREDGLDFNINDISSSSIVNSAMDDFTPDAIGAGVTDIAPINDFIDDCLAEAVGGIRRYINDILQNVEDGIDLIDSILALAENLLMKALQRIWKLVDSIQSLISSLDIKITCITSKDDTGKYTDQIQNIENRMDVVIDDLYLADDGSFDSDRLMGGFNGDLQSNLNSYKSRSDDLQSEIDENIQTTVNIPTTVNPSNRF
jgi:hypothetical protein